MTDVELQSYLKRREYEFKNMQIIYDLIKIAKENITKLTTFKARYKKIEKIRENFIETSDYINKLQLKINPNFNIDNGALLSFDELYYAAVEFADSLESSAITNSQFDSCRRQSTISQVKLPKLQIPKFDGYIENWQTFKDSYVPLIHSNVSLSDTEKFHYLLSCLSGSALSLAKGIPITSSNYSVVYGALLDRYDNKRILATTYLEKIFKLAPIQRPTLNSLSELTNILYESVNALRALNIDELGEFVLFYIASRSLDVETRKRFELQNNDEIPKFNNLVIYLQNYIKVLEVSQPVSTTASNQTNKQFRNNKVDSAARLQRPSLVATTKQFPNNNNKANPIVCTCCNENHSIYRCGKMHSMSIEQRQKFVRDLKLCANCLRPGHDSAGCTSKSTCFVCNAKHNTLLHVEKRTVLTQSVDSNSTATSSTSLSSATKSKGSIPSAITKILGSAVVRIRHADGSYQYARALIDSGSMDSFITSACARRLGLHIKKCNLSVTGLGENFVCSIKGFTFGAIIPGASESPQFNLSLVVLPKITSMMPSSTLPTFVKENFKHLDLADCDFYKSGPIDLLLGVECFDQIYTGSRYTAGPGLPCALSSVFGWVISGQFLHHTKAQTPSEPVTSLIASSCALDDIVKRFWESEEPPKCKISIPEDEICEQNYKSGTYRTEDGRYVVPIMLKDDAPPLGDSYRQAFNRFLNLEKRLLNQTELKAEYQEFMRQYGDLGHMQPAESSSTDNYIIPHHCVVRPDSSTTRLRVVFDASSRTTNNHSLNNIVYVGPKLQIDIVDLITKFRLHKIVFTADICKMYRQILIRPEDRCYQHILWRKDPHESLSEYELNTVTYGVSSSPYLAIRTLHQLAKDHGHEYSSRAAEVLSGETFMDDITTGCSSLQEARQLKADIVSLLSKGHFELRKWSTNTAELLSDVPSDHCQTSKSFDESGNEFVKILGIRWNPSSDNFSYTFSDSFDVNFTKRSILSIVARIFDPLGWICPVVFAAKSLLQDMWRLNLAWDEAIPKHLAKQWHSIAVNLSDLQNITLPRLVIPPDPMEIHLIGFCDGSLKGYGCCVYLCVVTNENATVPHLLIGKSRVAPLRPTTINRLELSAAVLLARVLSHMYNLLKEKIHINSIRAYSDSSTTLSWLNTAPHLLKMYVANRVVQATDLISCEHWYHVSTNDNPADCCSRGVSCMELTDHPLWWNGPSWLQTLPSEWPGEPTLLPSEELAELKPDVTGCLHTAPVDNVFLNLISKYSNFTRLQRILAWCLRFISNAQVVKSNRNSCFLKSFELDKSSKVLVKITQTHFMNTEVSKVENHEQCVKSIQKLSPFLDDDGLLRVGGRIEKAHLAPSALHPMLLTKDCRLSRLIVEHFHLKYLHCGPRTLQSLIQRKFWIIGLRLLIRNVLSKCMQCFKVKPLSSQPLMGNLPAERLQPTRCFQTTGIDFGGPFWIKESRRRGAKTYKAYLCLFVCLSSKAVHLEAVTELSSEAFLAALDRFVSRRGMCHTIVTDNGTNFVGANKYLKEVIDELRKHYPEISNGLANRQITWKFNPPGAPHFGGIFESGIKSTKYHLKRVVGAQILTFEEFITILSKVEAVLNSRPLCSLSPDPTEADVLTPGHFLTGGPLVSLPEEPISENTCPRSRWQMLKKITQSFWRIWQRDYLHTLQQKNKWFQNAPNIKENDLVLLNDPNLPPLLWKLARVDQVHPGSDNIVRVVSLRTANGKILRRPVVKVCPLPVN